MVLMKIASSQAFFKTPLYCFRFDDGHRETGVGLNNDELVRLDI